MVVPTDQAVTSWKGRRTTAANNLQLAMDRVDPLISGNPDLTIENLERMLCELEVKLTSYERAHNKILGNATDEQLAQGDYGNLISVEHETLLKKLEGSNLKLQLEKEALDRAAENTVREDLGSQHAQEAFSIRNKRIQALRNILDYLKQQQEQG